MCESLGNPASRWDELRKGAGSAGASTWDRIREENERTRMKRPSEDGNETEKHALDDDDDEATHRKVEQEKFDALLEAERKLSQ